MLYDYYEASMNCNSAIYTKNAGLPSSGDNPNPLYLPSFTFVRQ